MSRVFAILAVILALVAPLRAHELTVDNVTLKDEGEGAYSFHCNVSLTQLQTMGLPQLPARCKWRIMTPDEARTATTSDPRFICEGNPLDAADKIILPWKRNGVLVTAHWADGTTARQFFLSGPDGIVVELSSLKAGSGSWLKAARRYTQLGIEHILMGLDHILFVIGLLLLVRGARRLALTITAFTVAHSLTLALSVLGAVTLSQSTVDAIVALSIVFLAIEILNALRGRSDLTMRHPWMVAFGFGLIHGLGFAGALQGIGLPRAEVPTALVAFNIGVELGQLGVVALWLLCAWAARESSLALPRKLRWAPGYALGITAMFWFLERSIKLFA